MESRGEYVGGRPRWWLVGGAVALGVAAGVAVVGTLTGVDARSLISVGVLVLVAAVSWRMDRHAPRRVVATVAGVSVVSRSRTRDVPWPHVRRVRTEGGLGLPAHDALLDRGPDGLVRLPRRLPAGTVEQWRHDMGGAAPASGLPDSWHLTSVSFVASSLAPAFAVAAALFLVNGVDSRLEVGALLLAAVLTALSSWYGSPFRASPRQVSADQEGLRHGFRGRRRVLWSDVVAVRPADRFQDGAVLRRQDGSEVEVAGPPAAVAQGWWESSRRP